MKKNILLIALLLIVTVVSAQKNQKIAYIDLEYILKNVPEYLETEKSLDEKVIKWKNILDKKAREIEILKTDLANEKAILTDDLVKQLEEDITVKQKEFRELESSYFGANGRLYSTRKQLIQPIQDKVYNAVQDIAKHKKYDFIFDKSSDLIMLYSNKKYDISNLVIKLIKIGYKRDEKANIVAERKKLLGEKELSDKQKKIISEKEERKQKLIEERKKRLKKIEEKRKAKLKERREKRELLKQQREKSKK
ncbi:MAG: OmpH family outer membrane protein [Tenacibaculum sp.]|nr:OmpH family outer membrane protein [Tenacibaculum sp.]